MNSIYVDYINRREELREFYRWLPGDSIENVIKEFVNTTINYGNEVNIISGQQPAIFGGPCYTLYKVITLAKLAEHYEKTLKLRMKPIFWIHSWDHDWEEACNINFLTYDYQVYKVSYTPDPEQKGKSLFKLLLNPDSLVREIDSVFSKVKGSEYTQPLKEFLSTSLQNHKNLADWSTTILIKLFSKEKIIWFEPHKTTDYKKLQELIEIAIENHAELYHYFQRTNEKINHLGYKPQVHKLPTDAFFFIEENGYRQKLIYEDKNFISASSGNRYTKQDLKRILQSEPQLFTPNLILRCIYQQMIFPCVMYIGGPAEVAYWAQLTDLFQFLNLQLPIVYPRKRIMILPEKIKKWMEELGFSSQFHNHSKIECKRDILNSISEKMNHEIEIIKKELLMSVNNYSKKIPELLSMESKLYENQQRQYVKKLMVETERYINELIKIYINKNKQIQNRVNAINNTIYPMEKEQERVFSPLSFISEYGEYFIEKIKDNIDILDFNVKVIEL